MQNRYVGDIGDFAKYGLLRALCKEQNLGIAWYLYPDESHNEDGKHIAYLSKPEKWRHLDPNLFDQLKDIVGSSQRAVSRIEDSSLFENSRFSNSLLKFDGTPHSKKCWRKSWFENVISELHPCDVVFADPDNGLCENEKYRPASYKFWKRMPLSEARVLAANRTAIIYHHNTRRAGGHYKEIQYWLSELGTDTIALYWRHISNRTLFVVNPTTEIEQRARKFAGKWAPFFELHSLPKSKHQTAKSCPECGHVFKGVG